MLCLHLTPPAGTFAQRQRQSSHSSLRYKSDTASSKDHLVQEQEEKMKSLSLALALVLVLLLSSPYLQVIMVAADDCNTKCQKRCSLKVAGRCMGLCMMCCGKCSGCVPDGPRASKDACPCYRDMTSPKSGRSKCP